MNYLRKIALQFSERARSRRAEIFRDGFALTPQTRILDLGSEAGENIHRVLRGSPVPPENVFIADIEENAVLKGAELYGFTPVVIHESGKLPFPDAFFDIVYCSSVIEHVTLPKQEVWRCFSGKRFSRRSQQHQR
jgi:SAM-dependent methyltransferase